MLTTSKLNQSTLCSEFSKGAGDAVMLRNQRGHNTVTTAFSLFWGLYEVTNLLRKVGSGGRDRIADLGL